MTTIILQTIVYTIQFKKKINMQIKHNWFKNPNWPEANQLAIYKRGRGFETQIFCETNPASGQSGT